MFLAKLSVCTWVTVKQAILSKSESIPSSIKIILDGEVRLLGEQKNKPITIAKLGYGSIIGLGSILCNYPFEEVSISKKSNVLTIEDDFIINL